MARYFMSDAGEWADHTKPVQVEDGSVYRVELGAVEEHPKGQQYELADNYDVEQYMDEIESLLLTRDREIERLREAPEAQSITLTGYYSGSVWGAHDTLNLMPCPMCGDPPTTRAQGNAHTKKRSIVIECKKCRISHTNAVLTGSVDRLVDYSERGWNRRPVISLAHPDEAAG